MKRTYALVALNGKIPNKPHLLEPLRQISTRAQLCLALFTAHAMATAVCCAANLTINLQDARSAEPIPAATITLSCPGQPEASAEAPDNGVVSFQRLNPGTCFVRAQAPDYWDPSAGPHPVQIAAASQSLSIHLLKTGVISGLVRNATGDPVVGAEVFALANNDHAVGEPGHTDDRGAYRLYNLPPASYRIAAAPASDNSSLAVLAPAYHDPNIDLQPGETRSDVDLTLADNVAPWTVSGHVSPPGNPTLVALFNLGAAAIPVAALSTGVDGNFSIPGVPSGTYRLVAWSPATDITELQEPGNRPAFGASQVVTVAGSAAEVSLPLQKLLNATGSLHSAESACELHDVVFHPLQDAAGWLTVHAAIEGNHFTIQGLLPGPYQIELPNSGCQVTSISIGTNKRSGNVIDLSRPVSGLVLDLTPNPSDMQPETKPKTKQ